MTMMMADGSTGLCPGREIGAGDEIGDAGDGGEEILIDLDALARMLGPDDSSDPYQNGADDFSYKNPNAQSAFNFYNYGNLQLQSETSGAGTEVSCSSFDFAGNPALPFNNVMVESSSNISSSIYPFMENFEGSYPSFQGDQGTEGIRVTDSEILCGSATSSFVKEDSNHLADHMDDLSANFVSDASCSGWIDSWRYGVPQAGHSLGISGLGIGNMPVMDTDVSCDVVSAKSTFGHNSDVPTEQFCFNEDGIFLTGSPQFNFPPDLNPGLFFNSEVTMTKEKDEGYFRTEGLCSASEMPIIDSSYEKGMNFQCEGGNYSVAIDRKYSSLEDSNQSLSGISPSRLTQKHAIHLKHRNEDKMVTSAKALVDGLGGNSSDQHSACAQPSTMSNEQLNHSKNEQKRKLFQPTDLGSHLSRVSPESIHSNSSGGKSYNDDHYDICILEEISQPACTNQYSPNGKAMASLQSPAYGHSRNYTGVGGMRLKANDERFIFQVALQDLSQPKSEASLPDGVLTVPLLRHQRIALSWMIQKETSGINCSGGILADDQGLGKTVSTIALILKERRPSLSLGAEAVKKEQFETLDLDEEDDEVIEVKKRPSLRLDAEVVKKEKVETCDMEDDGKATEVIKMKDCADGSQFMSSQSSTRNVNSIAKGRPAGGTLVVCPTSVLRQWADELHKKVSSQANISVLVYHGSSRTKDPCELAKYDVVLTTYSIVSMEVPKQPICDEDPDKKRKLQSGDVPSLGLSSGKKRKYPVSSDEKGGKNSKRIDGALLDSITRPLAKVGWFRVVLDEAQSIKNHRTQVARACWGLRAKRRWCLSGTPIQNAIDDLYSYFRFLRYDPYAVYKFFCGTLKFPIQKNPTRGYKKLQAVLKTIMLRRTKGTLIDGEPIITLPPKLVELKKVDFTEGERDFYTRLEADSRAQFKEYAAAGTVKQNYVNILLMLLRLRQACDHPLLVRGCTSNSFGKSSIEMAKKLPLEKQMCLMQFLEASLAICGICNDPPEDAVVSVCGHVFCNQCICEHLSGDDNQCPLSNCKVQLNSSSVFSKATLNSCLTHEPVQNTPGSEHNETFDAYPAGCPYESSKIRAALEVLQSLTKQHDSTSINSYPQNFVNGNVTSPQNSSTSGGVLNDGTDNGKAIVEKNANSSMKVVGEKAIVFSQWTRMLDLLEACLKNSSIQYRRLDGTMSVIARDKAVKDFNTLPEVSVMIMSLKAASLGLNMVAASRVLLLDLWWNPTTEDQAIDRAHRIGQTRPVTVLRLTVKDTVEDRILALQQKKRKMVASAFGEDETGGRQTRLTVDDLQYLFMA